MATDKKEASRNMEGMLSAGMLLEKATITNFTSSQAKLTAHLIQLLASPVTFEKKEENNKYTALLREIYTAQDTIFVVKKRYNKEVSYYNTRTRIFPGFLIAPIFGFDKLSYHPAGDDVLMPSHKIFPEKP